jgi:hypothetical protein
MAMERDPDGAAEAGDEVFRRDDVRADGSVGAR